MTTQTKTKPERYLSLKELIARGIVPSRTTVYRMMEKIGFPQQVQLSERARGWRESEVEAWLASRPKGVGDKAA